MPSSTYLKMYLYYFIFTNFLKQPKIFWNDAASEHIWTNDSIIFFKVIYVPFHFILYCNMMLDIFMDLISFTYNIHICIFTFTYIYYIYTNNSYWISNIKLQYIFKLSKTYNSLKSKLTYQTGDYIKDYTQMHEYHTYIYIYIYDINVCTFINLESKGIGSLQAGWFSSGIQSINPWESIWLWFSSKQDSVLIDEFLLNWWWNSL